jgi:hypothetical protein
MHPMQDYFWKVFHKYYNLICIFICTPICTKKILILAKSGCYMVVLELRMSSPFGTSSLDSGPFVEKSGKISHGVLYDG